MLLSLAVLFAMRLEIAVHCVQGVRGCRFKWPLNGKKRCSTVMGKKGWTIRLPGDKLFCTYTVACAAKSVSGPLKRAIRSSPQAYCSQRYHENFDHSLIVQSSLLSCAECTPKTNKLSNIVATRNFTGDMRFRITLEIWLLPSSLQFLPILHGLHILNIPI